MIAAGERRDHGRRSRFAGFSLFAIAVTGSLAAPPVLHAQSEPATVRLTVEVLDPSGARVPGAGVRVSTPTGSVVVDTQTDGSGEAAMQLPPGEYTVHIALAGFASQTVTGLIVGSVDVRRSIRLALARIAEDLVVARDAQSAALDPRDGAFSALLTREQIDALPDDPEALAAALQALAPPGTVIRIDGFLGGPLPPKSQILSIRLPRADVFSAQEHAGASAISFIDIVTQPGDGRLQGSADVALGDERLNARNPLASTKTPESVEMAGFAISGPIHRGRTSFSFSARGGTRRDTVSIHAALPGGVRQAEAVERPQSLLTLNGRVVTLLDASHTLRIQAAHTRNRRRNLGIGDFNLLERGYSSAMSDTLLTASISGPVGRRAYVEGRSQLRRLVVGSRSYTEAPTVRVLEAFTAGGAQTAGIRRSVEWETASDVDYAHGRHALRFGALVQGGHYESSATINYLGTFTFASLADYSSGHPATYTRRLGNPLIAYANTQLGLYVQDDFRVAPSVMWSYGVRYEVQTRFDDRLNLQPRVTVTWSPYTHGRLTIRGGVGVFNDWIGTSVIEQVLAVDGTRQRDVHLANPAYPEPDLVGVAAPVERYSFAEDLSLPRSVGLLLAVDRRLTARLRVTAAVGQRVARGLLRGHNLNAPLNGQRPDPLFGNVIETRSDAGSHGRSVTLTWNLSLPELIRGLASGSYATTNHRDNTDGAFWVPPGNESPALEWGATVPRHRFTTTLTTQPVAGTSATITTRWQSGMPYNITSGVDANGDGLFTERLPGVARNTGRTPHHWDVTLRLSYALRVGRRSNGRAGSIPDTRDPQTMADALTRGTGPRYRIELFATAQNLTNHPNYVGYGGVITSPLFGRPIGVLNPRRIELGMRFNF